MTDAPERIWAIPMPSDIDNLNLTSAELIAYQVPRHGARPYTRTDLYTAACAERDALRAQVAELEMKVFTALAEKVTSYNRGVLEGIDSTKAIVAELAEEALKGTPNAD